MACYECIYPCFLHFKAQTDVQCINVEWFQTPKSAGVESLSAAFQKSRVKCLQMQWPVATDVKFHRGQKTLPCCFVISWWRVSCMWAICVVFSCHFLLSLRLRLKDLWITKAISSTNSGTAVPIPPLVRLKQWKPLASFPSSWKFQLILCNHS